MLVVSSGEARDQRYRNRVLAEGGYNVRLDLLISKVSYDHDITIQSCAFSRALSSFASPSYPYSKHE